MTYIKTLEQAVISDTLSWNTSPKSDSAINKLSSSIRYYNKALFGNKHFPVVGAIHNRTKSLADVGEP